MSLDSIREQIDTLDTELLKLLNERADLVHQVGEIKKKDGIEIYAPEREESCSLAPGSRGANVRATQYTAGARTRQTSTGQEMRAAHPPEKEARTNRCAKSVCA